MKLHIIPQNIIRATIWLIVSIAEYTFLSALSFSNDSLSIVSMIVLVNCVIQLMVIKRCTGRFVGFFSAFLVFLYLFHFGQVICDAFFSSMQFDITDYINVYATDKAVIWEAIIKSLNVTNFFFIGGLFTMNAQSLPIGSALDEIEQQQSYNCCASFSKLIFAISTPFRLFFDVRSLLAAFIGGYRGVIDTSSGSGILGAIAGFWYVSIPLVYLSIRSPIKRKWFFYLTTLYLIITMFTGARGHQIVGLIGTLIIIYYYENRKISPAKLVKVVLAGLLLLMIIDLIFDVRHESISYFLDNPSVMIKNVLEKNIIIETVYSFGATIYTPYLVLAGRGSLFSPWFGESILKSLFHILPNVGGIFTNVDNAAIFSRMLKTSHAIGGSFVGEMIYNFGSLYWVFPVIVGAFYEKLSERIQRYIVVKDYSKVCVIAPVLIYSLWWVRGTIADVVRPVVWLLILFYINKSVSRKV